MALPTYEAEFKYGDVPQTMEHTPVADVDAGEVVVVGELVGVAIRPIPAGELGTLNIFGGVYRVLGAGEYDAGDRVYWDDTANKVTTDAGSGGANKPFGVLTTDCAGDDEYCEVAHRGAA